MKNWKEIKISYESLQTEKKLKPWIEKILKKLKPHVLENLKDYPIMVILKKSLESLVEPESEFENIVGVTEDALGVIRFNKNSRCFIIEIKESLLESKNKKYIERIIAETLLRVHVIIEDLKLGIPINVIIDLNKADVHDKQNMSQLLKKEYTYLNEDDVRDELISHGFIEIPDEEILICLEEGIKGGIISEKDLLDYAAFCGFTDTSKVKKLIKKARAKLFGN